jgi:hypothetical protein
MSTDITQYDASHADGVYVGVAYDRATGQTLIALDAAAAGALRLIVESVSADRHEILDGSAGYSADDAPDVVNTAGLLYSLLAKHRVGGY